MNKFNQWLESGNGGGWKPAKELLDMAGVGNTSYNRQKLAMLVNSGALECRQVEIHIKGKFRYEYRPTGQERVA